MSNQALTDRIKREAANCESNEPFGDIWVGKGARLGALSQAIGFFPALQSVRKYFESLAARAPGRAKRRPKVVSVNTFSAWPICSGGQQRMLNINASLATQYDVTIICFHHCAKRTETFKFSENFRQIVVAMTPDHRNHEIALSSSLGGVPVGDIAAIHDAHLTPAFLKTLASALAGADIVIAEHPYCFNAIRRTWRGPLVYSAHNVEADVKAAILPQDAAGRAALREVSEIEAACCASADVIWVVGDEDGAKMATRYCIAPQKIVVVPNGTNLPKNPVLDFDERSKRAERLGLPGKTAIYIGSDHGPNIEGALATLEIARTAPDWWFLLIGTICENAAVREATRPPNVVLLGMTTTQELLTVMAAAAVGLNPVDTGGGTSLKVLDYAANGLVVVTTPFGNRGVSFNGEQCFVAAPQDMAAMLGIISHTSHARLEQIAGGGFKHVAEEFNWKKIGDQLVVPSLHKGARFKPE
jgi:glycosyltransferase involved in cell wall biosynthesis